MPTYYHDHVHLTSPDPLKTAEFYEKIFGAKRERVVELPDGRLHVFLTLNSSRIVVTRPVGDKPFYGLEHFGFVTDNIEDTMVQLKAAGMKIRDEIKEVPGGVKYAFFWAPDNVLIELIQR